MGLRCDRRHCKTAEGRYGTHRDIMSLFRLILTLSPPQTQEHGEQLQEHGGHGKRAEATNQNCARVRTSGVIHVGRSAAETEPFGFEFFEAKW